MGDRSINSPNWNRDMTGGQNELFNSSIQTSGFCTSRKYVNVSDLLNTVLVQKINGVIQCLK